MQAGAGEGSARGLDALRSTSAGGREIVFSGHLAGSNLKSFQVSDGDTAQQYMNQVVGRQGAELIEQLLLLSLSGQEVRDRLRMAVRAAAGAAQPAQDQARIGAKGLDRGLGVGMPIPQVLVHQGYEFAMQVRMDRARCRPVLGIQRQPMRGQFRDMAQPVGAQPVCMARRHQQDQGPRAGLSLPEPGDPGGEHAGGLALEQPGKQLVAGTDQDRQCAGLLFGDLGNGRVDAVAVDAAMGIAPADPGVAKGAVEIHLGALVDPLLDQLVSA
jgi:hypothetical protein